MARINVLDRSISELIAAGEVIERPSSVIKELVENSIDAGAKSITIEIQDGGISFMRVTDDGCGIVREDIPKAFLRHATSKVNSKDDLNNIFTLGFRGEALASICAVAKVELITKCNDDICGTKYSIYGGEEVSVEDSGCPQGTTIIVRDLFYNVPARMKFLKKDVSEANSVAAMIDRIAMSHPEIAFNFIREGRQELKTSGNGDLLQCIYAVFGKVLTKTLIPVNYQFKNIKISGYVSKPEGAVANRVKQLFFINGRFVKTKTGGAAVEEAFRRSIPVGKFPVCFLNISMEYSDIDVNVHPTKLEVRFTDEKLIFDAVYHSVKSAILNNSQPTEIEINKNKSVKTVNEFNNVPYSQTKITENNNEDDAIVYMPPKSEFGFEKSKLNDAIIQKDNNSSYNKPLYKQNIASVNEQNIVYDTSNELRTIFSAENIVSSNEKKEKKISEVEKNDFIKQENKENEIINNDISLASENTHISDNKEKSITIKEEYEAEETFIKYIGEAFDTYIIVEYGKDKIMIIDKHAAHERIIYEKLRATQGECAAQYLLEPITLTLDKTEYDAVLSNKDTLYRLGYEIDDFGAGTIIVRSAPEYLRTMNISETLTEIISFLMDNKKDLNTEKVDWFFANIACRSAIKAGDKSTAKELIDIAIKVEKDKQLCYCPHGRPVSVVLTRKELEKQFFRV